MVASDTSYQTINEVDASKAHKNRCIKNNLLCQFIKVHETSFFP